MIESAIQAHAAALEKHAAALEKLAAAIAQHAEHAPTTMAAILAYGKPTDRSVNPAETSAEPKPAAKEQPKPQAKAEQAEKPADKPAEKPVESAKTPADEPKAEQAAEPAAPTYALPEGVTLTDARKIIRKGLTEALKFAAANSQKRLEQLKNFCIEHGAKNPDLIPDDKVAEVWCRLRDELKITLEA